VVATLAVLLARVVVFPAGWLALPDVHAVLIAVAAWLALERAQWPLGWVLAGAAAAGLLPGLLQQ
jgi:hypothetical protein